ncbi:MAG: hypothetical protein ACP5QP_08195, partial [Brevinematia bacterium]
FGKKRNDMQPLKAEDVYNAALGKLKNVQHVTLQTIHEDLLLLLDKFPERLKKAFETDSIKVQIEESSINKLKSIFIDDNNKTQDKKVFINALKESIDVNKALIEILKKSLNINNTFNVYFNEKLINKIIESLDVLKSYSQTLLDVLFGEPGKWDHSSYELGTKLMIAEGIGLALRELPQISPIRTNDINFPQVFAAKIENDYIKTKVIELPSTFTTDLTNSFKASFNCTIC